MANDVAELDNHQEHVALRQKEERPIRINDDSRDRQSIREAIASCIDFFAVLDIFTGRVIDDPAVTCSMEWKSGHVRCVHMRAIGQTVSIHPNQP